MQRSGLAVDERADRKRPFDRVTDAAQAILVLEAEPGRAAGAPGLPPKTVRRRTTSPRFGGPSAYLIPAPQNGLSNEGVSG